MRVSWSRFRRERGNRRSKRRALVSRRGRSRAYETQSLGVVSMTRRSSVFGVVLVLVASTGCASREERDDVAAAMVTASGRLACSPGDRAVDACTGKIAGDACGRERHAGTCRATVDEAAIGCVRDARADADASDDRPGERHHLLDRATAACTSLAAGAACSLGEHEGTCIAERVAASGTTTVGAICLVPCEALERHHHAHHDHDR
jgi:hypothetical protein